jgi:dCTP deaminase
MKVPNDDRLEISPASDATLPTVGALPSQMLERLIEQDVIAAEIPVGSDQVQPASIDLRLGARAYRVRSSFLPGRGHTVMECIERLAMHEIDLGGGAVLERDCVYIVPLMEALALPKEYHASGNPKSSTGRLDVFTRLITDDGTEFDQVPPGYKGPIYAEIAPRTFSVLVRPGTTLSQLRIRVGRPARDDALHVSLQSSFRLIDTELESDDIRNGVPVSVDVRGDASDSLIGYRAKRHAGVIDMDLFDHYEIGDYWEPLFRSRDNGLILDPGEFYILMSKEAVHVPVDYAAEMVAYDTLVGEFRVHYAGFFDPGFGAPEAGGAGSRAVLEVRSFEVPFMLEHGQKVGRLVYEPLAETPEKIYGRGLKSSYQSQGLKLSKHFRAAQ